jgi:hypothetical protein
LSLGDEKRAGIQQAQKESGMTHTPGPWVFENFDEAMSSRPKSDVATVAHVGVYRVGIRTGVPGGNYRDGRIASEEHDARLIAAAPAMLEALKKAVERLEFEARHDDDWVIADMRAVIALAEGKAK